MSATKKKVSPAATEQFEDFAAQASNNMKENFEKVSKSMNDAGEFSKGNIEAVIEATSTFAKGVEEIATGNAEFAQSSLDRSIEQFKSVSSLKSPQEVFQAQSDFFKTVMEANIAQMQKVSDAWTETTKTAVEPLNKRYSEAVEKAQSYKF